MCGIAGVYWPDRPGAIPSDLGPRLQKAIARRGPDGDGSFADPAAGVLLVHTRLAIRDLSPLGAQPMTSHDGRFVISYNGELYNADALRARIEQRGGQLRGHSDTELLVETIARFGMEEALHAIEGIFAFAAWDVRERRLWLVRDRVGIKPLYVAVGIHGGVAFASELAALEVIPGLELTPDPAAACAYFALGYVPDTQAIFHGVSKVQPGQAWCIVDGQASPRVLTYHDRNVAALGSGRAALHDPDAATRALSTAIDEAVASQLVADVQVGVFLSGGIDSSMVAAAAVRASTTQVKTFCIGFDDPRYDESSSARAVATHLGTDHHELILQPARMLDSVRAAESAFSEPFADSSLLPTWLVCQFARQHVTVALSGDGGDELFGGYNRHVWLPRVLGAQRLVPSTARTALSRGLSALSEDTWDRLLAPAAIRTPGMKIHKLSRLLVANDLAGLLSEATSTGPLASGLVRDMPSVDATPMVELADARSSLMHHDFRTYLPGDILTKVDRCSMDHGLEARVPLLDEQLVALAGRISPKLKVRHGKSKWVLRQVLAERVPSALFERPKMGFAIPLGDWLRGPLRPWAEDLLSARALADSPILDAAAVRLAWRGVLEKRPMYEFGVWALLMWQSWSRRRRTVWS